MPLIVVSRQLGHANPQVTATVHAHLLGDSQLDQAAGVFGAGTLRGSAPATKKPMDSRISTRARSSS